MNIDTHEIKNGLCLVCSREGQILRVPFDDLEMVPKDRLPAQFSDIIDRESIGKAANFWEEILDNEFVFDYQLYVRQDEEPVPLHFSAATFNGQVWIIAAANDEMLEKMLDEMMLINNEQQNRIRRTEKKLSKLEQYRPDPSLDTYDEISKVNNELINVQRQLMKQNREISNLNEQLNRSNRELEHFAYAVSHDLKEPLRMIRSFMRLLEKKYGDELDEKAREYIHYAVDGAERMNAMISSLLEYSRVGRKNREAEEVDLNKVVDKVTRLNRSVIEEHGGAVKCADLPVVVGQEVPLQQLFNNLVSNALKYRKAGTAPVVEIRFKEKPKEWIFTVSDSGRGIAPEYHETIFDLFQRVESAAEEETGTGMGLAICKKIVEHHGGEIWVESEPGEGSTFYFTIAKE
ncbi:ATP-binding protein [Halalkalibaculum sp. DA3122]|uniref:sensor histidine kinase n=1 Tax=Halalkalibaculum sp. DA3122 TaxID=3373607 RepID=UPI003754D976